MYQNPDERYRKLGGWLMYIFVMSIVFIAGAALSLPTSLRTLFGGFSTPFSVVSALFSIAALVLNIFVVIYMQKRNLGLFKIFFFVSRGLSVLNYIVMAISYAMSGGALRAVVWQVMDLYEQILGWDASMMNGLVDAVMRVTLVMYWTYAAIYAGVIIAWVFYFKRSRRAAVYFDPNYVPPAWPGYNAPPPYGYPSQDGYGQYPQGAPYPQGQYPQDAQYPQYPQGTQQPYQPAGGPPPAQPQQPPQPAPGQPAGYTQQGVPVFGYPTQQAPPPAPPQQYQYPYGEQQPPQQPPYPPQAGGPPPQAGWQPPAPPPPGAPMPPPSPGAPTPPTAPEAPAASDNPVAKTAPGAPTAEPPRSDGFSPAPAAEPPRDGGFPPASPPAGEDPPTEQ